MAQEESSVVADSDPSARILAELLQRLEDAGEPITISASKLAVSMGIPVAAFRQHVRGFFSDGRLIKLGAGFDGTRIAAPGSSTPTQAPESAEGIRVPVTNPSASPERPVAPEPSDEGSEEDRPAKRRSVKRIPPDIVREKVHTYIKEAIDPNSGKLAITTTRLAMAVDASVLAVTKQVQSLVDRGHILTERGGRTGTIYRLGTGARSRTPRSQPATAPQPKAARAATGFCPWCGSKINQAGWKYCQSCGERLSR